MVRTRHPGRVFGILLAICACLLWLAAPAGAAGPVVDQYSEQIPTAGGDHQTNGGGDGGGGTGGSNSTGGTGGTSPTSGGSPVVLPANVTSDNGKDAKELREVATSPRFGAPEQTLSLPDNAVAAPSALPAAVGAVTDGSDGRMIGLFIALLAVTAVSLGVAAARRRNS